MTKDPVLLPKDVESKEIVYVSESILQKISGVEVSEGILAVVAMPQTRSIEEMHYIVVLDGINDPGNLGTILRTALALGWEGAVFLSDSCDPFNAKALRAAKGATFRLPLCPVEWKDLCAHAHKHHLKLWAADIHGKPLEAVISTEKPERGVILVLGNESHGVSKEVLKQCEKIKITMRGPMESLNVAIAGGILLHNLMK